MADLKTSIRLAVFLDKVRMVKSENVYIGPLKL